jgi:hypothetical protein
MNALFSTAYFPNAIYYANFLRYEKVKIDIFEHFPKQTYRNRCYILAANGVMPLTVPVLKGRTGKIMTKDIKISYIENWQHQHFQSIMSAYSAAPFYDFFIDTFSAVFNKKFDFLIDLNNEIFSSINKILNIDTKIEYTDDFVQIDVNNPDDYRFAFSPKNKINFSNSTHINYIQVFSDRYEFVPNLSILDLIFNLGLDTKKYLQDFLI